MQTWPRPKQQESGKEVEEISGKIPKLGNRGPCPKQIPYDTRSGRLNRVDSRIGVLIANSWTSFQRQNPSCEATKSACFVVSGCLRCCPSCSARRRSLCQDIPKSAASSISDLVRACLHSKTFVPAAGLTWRQRARPAEHAAGPANQTIAHQSDQLLFPSVFEASVSSIPVQTKPTSCQQAWFIECSSQSFVSRKSWSTSP